MPLGNLELPVNQTSLMGLWEKLGYLEQTLVFGVWDETGRTEANPHITGRTYKRHAEMPQAKQKA